MQAWLLAKFLKWTVEINKPQLSNPWSEVKRKILSLLWAVYKRQLQLILKFDKIHSLCLSREKFSMKWKVIRQQSKLWFRLSGYLQLKEKCKMIAIKNLEFLIFHKKIDVQSIYFLQNATLRITNKNNRSKWWLKQFLSLQAPINKSMCYWQMHTSQLSLTI